MSHTDYKLEEIHQVDFCNKVRELLQIEILDFVDEFSKEFFTIQYCPACNSAKINFSFECLGMHYDECNDCATVFINPCPSQALIVNFLNSSEAFALWREQMPMSMQDSRQKLYQVRLELLLELADEMNASDLTVIEVGAGRGELSKLLMKENSFSKLILVEPQELILDSSKVSIIRSSFESADILEPADLLIAFEVLEHLVDPVAFLEKAYSHLKSNGALVITSPNANSLEVNLLKDKSEQVPFDHIRLYNPVALRFMLEKIGFQDIRITTPGKFDADLLKESIQDLDTNWASVLTYLLEDEYKKSEFQNFLVENNLSSHMRCVAFKR
jgi:SAM-dependent methyltransferase